MTNNRLNINYTRFARKENKEKENCAIIPKLGQIFLTKNLESRKRTIRATYAVVQTGAKIFCRKF